MSIDFELQRADFIAFSEERQRFSPVWLSRLYYYWILPILGVALAVVIDSFAIAAVFTVLFVLAHWFIQTWIKRLYYRMAYSDENLARITGRWTATVMPEGFHVSSDACEALYRWPHVRRVFRSSHYVMIECSPIQRTHIPIRAFSDEAQIQAFIQAMQSYIQSPV